MSDDPESRLRIGILVVAYNAALTLASVLDRIPPEFRSRISEVIVSDDSSTDSTYLVGLGYKQLVADLPLTVLRNPENLGYGGNQKVGYRLAIEHDLDVIVLLHGDGQYAPELLPAMVAPLEDGPYDAVFGSRMLEPGAARRGGMPLYKLAGNRVLTRIENQLLGTTLSEFHSGYRAYSVAALRKLDFESYSDDFDFDTEIIIGLVDHRMAIREIPIPTYYGDEICYVNGIRYARQVVRAVVDYRLRQSTGPSPMTTPTVPASLGPSGAGPAGTGSEWDRYPPKLEAGSSHGRLLARVTERTGSTVLDLGCGAGYLSGQWRAGGLHVTGVDSREAEGVRTRVDRLVLADLDDGLPAEIDGPFDIVVLGDVLEHLRHPDRLLEDLHRVIDPRSTVLVTLPNFAHWYVRAKVGAGRFDYESRGILDEDHVRFFTLRTAEKLFERGGWRVIRTEAIGLPADELRHRVGGRLAAVLQKAEGAGLLVCPTWFAYQFLFELIAEPPTDTAAHRSHPARRQRRVGK